MKALSILFTLGLFSQIAFSQGQLSGVVNDKSSQKPIEFASVALYKSSESTLLNGGITDAEGKFLIDNLPQGSYYAMASYLGYKTLIISSIQLSKNEKKALEPIFLRSDLQELQGVEVQGQRISTDFQTQKQCFSADNFESSKGGTATAPMYSEISPV